MPDRLQKFLAQAGVASRRHAEEMITQGRVSVNGQVIRELGTKVDPDKDLVVVDGKPVKATTSHRTFLLYKPPGVVTTLSDPQGRPTIARFTAALGGRL